VTGVESLNDSEDNHGDFEHESTTNKPIPDGDHDNLPFFCSGQIWPTVNW
jgi:hypothetical protein